MSQVVNCSEAETLMKKGEALREAGDYVRAGRVLVEAMRLYQKCGDNRGEAHVWGHLGLTHQHQGSLHIAKACYAKSRALAEELGDPGLIAIARRHLAKIYVLEGDFNRAVTTLTEVINIVPGSRAHRAWFRHALVDAYWQAERRRDALRETWLETKDLLLGWCDEESSLGKRAWFTGMLLDWGKIPVVGVFPLTLAWVLANIWGLVKRTEHVRQAFGFWK